MPTQGSCLPFVFNSTLFPSSSTDLRGRRIDDVGFIAIRAMMGAPDEIPPNIPPALFDLKHLL